MIRKSLFTLTLGTALAFLAGPVAVSAQDLESVEPFKVGTFAIDNAPTVGLVMRDDQLIVDIALVRGSDQWGAVRIEADILFSRRCR